MEHESMADFLQDMILQEMIDRLEENKATKEEEEFLYELYINLRAAFTPTEIFL